jgi:hypothetical protein
MDPEGKVVCESGGNGDESSAGYSVYYASPLLLDLLLLLAD